MGKLVIVRHGESAWNLENRFTGWVDVDLTEKGVTEAKEAGKLLAEHFTQKGFEFQMTYTSLLRRAIKTHFFALDQMDRLWYPVERNWRLNERHYGALQGLDKAETAKKYGDEQVKIWRRSFDTPPPALETAESAFGMKAPLVESLKSTIDRFLPFWNETISPRLNQDQNILIVAHGNSLRALVKHVKNISDADILELNIPTGKPWELSFDSSGKFISDRYL